MDVPGFIPPGNGQFVVWRRKVRLWEWFQGNGSSWKIWECQQHILSGVWGSAPQKKGNIIGIFIWVGMKAWRCHLVSHRVLPVPEGILCLLEGTVCLLEFFHIPKSNPSTPKLGAEFQGSKGEKWVQVGFREFWKLRGNLKRSWRDLGFGIHVCCASWVFVLSCVWDFIWEAIPFLSHL